MLRFLTDEHVPRALIRGVFAREPALDLVRNQDVGLQSAVDTVLLDWAARNGRVILSEDRNTLIGLAYDRVARGQSFAGLVIYFSDASLGQLIDDLLIVAQIYEPDDIVNQVIYIPL